ncbi:MAG: DUF805 domain-containing protein [Minisyncoccia bacterium]
MFNGRIGIGQFWGALFFGWLCSVAALLLGGILLKFLLTSIPLSYFFLATIVAYGSIVAVLAFFSIGLEVRRLHDLGLSGWFVLIFLVISVAIMLWGTVQIDGSLAYKPWASVFLLISFIANLFISFWPGNKGENKYGPPVKYKSWGRALLGIKPDVDDSHPVPPADVSTSSGTVMPSGLFPENYTPSSTSEIAPETPPKTTVQ